MADEADLRVVDDWSRFVYERLKGWPPAETGRWSTWAARPANYLALEIVEQTASERSEPVIVYTSDEEVTWATRQWHEHRPWGDQTDDDAVEAVKERTRLWFSGGFLVVSYFLSDDWKTSLTIDKTDDLTKRLTEGLASVRKNFDADRVEVKGPYKSKDRVFSIKATGIQF